MCCSREVCRWGMVPAASFQALAHHLGLLWNKHQRSLSKYAVVVCLNVSEVQKYLKNVLHLLLLIEGRKPVKSPCCSWLASPAAAWQMLTLQVIFVKWTAVSALFSYNLCFCVTIVQNLSCHLKNTKLHDFVVEHKVQNMKWMSPSSWQLLTSLENLKK